MQWLNQSLQGPPQALLMPPVALLASGEGLASPDLGPEGLAAQIQNFDEEAKARGWALTRLSMGCVCCSSKLVMSTHLGRLLRLVKPSTVLLELDSQSHVDQAQTMLSEGQWQGWFDSIEVFQAL